MKNIYLIAVAGVIAFSLLAPSVFCAKEPVDWAKLISPSSSIIPQLGL